MTRIIGQHMAVAKRVHGVHCFKRERNRFHFKLLKQLSIEQLGERGKSAHIDWKLIHYFQFCRICRGAKRTQIQLQ